MRRYLVVANQTACGPHLADKVGELMATGPSRFHLVVPATHAHIHHTWSEGEAVAVARKRLAEALTRLRDLGADVDGEVGDGRPMDAVGDAIRDNPPAFDAIVLSTLPPGLSRWLNQDLPHRLERKYGLPILHVAGEVATLV